MSLLDWFSSRKPAKGVPNPAAPARVGHPLPGAEVHVPEFRKNERLAQRERLYVVVRDCMSKAGVLSAGYKFKVLSLDKRGNQFLVMLDLAGRNIASEGLLGQIEASIQQAAKARHDIEIKGVYWRQNEEMAQALRARIAEAQAQVAKNLPKPARPAAASHQPAARSGFDPIAADEVAAFKQALAAGTRKPVLAETAPQDHALFTGYEDTELPDPRPLPPRRPSALSGSQYGDLN